MRILAIIPARKGSKGIPRKNLHPLGGLPLIFHTLDLAFKSVDAGCITKLLVSTDDEEIVRRSKDRYNTDVSLSRPSELASDTAKTIDVVKHAIEHEAVLGHHFEAVLLLQPTSPLRTLDDINNSVRLFKQQQSDSLISVYQEPSLIPSILYTSHSEHSALPICINHNSGIRRQEESKVLVRNGSIYIASTELINRSNSLVGANPLVYLMPKDRSANIDTLADLELAEEKLRHGQI